MIKKFVCFMMSLLCILGGEILYLNFKDKNFSPKEEFAKLGIAGFALSHGCLRHFSNCDSGEIFDIHPALPEANLATFLQYQTNE